MLMPLAAAAVVLVVLFINELWWRKRRPHSELSRKFVHIVVGTFIAFWPFLMNWQQIKLFSLAFVLAVAVSKYFNIFSAIHSVTRPTWGEVCFALSVGVLAFLAPEPEVYAAALLHMSLADGLAALVGVRFGLSNRYTVFGHAKSIIGTMAFFVVSLVILGVYSYVAAAPFTLSLVWLAAGAALLENLAVRGLDNLFVPILIAIILPRL